MNYHFRKALIGSEWRNSSVEPSMTSPLKWHRESVNKRSHFQFTRSSSQEHLHTKNGFGICVLVYESQSLPKSQLSSGSQYGKWIVCRTVWDVNLYCANRCWLFVAVNAKKEKREQSLITCCDDGFCYLVWKALENVNWWRRRSRVSKWANGWMKVCVCGIFIPKSFEKNWWCAWLCHCRHHRCQVCVCMQLCWRWKYIAFKTRVDRIALASILIKPFLE